MSNSTKTTEQFLQDHNEALTNLCRYVTVNYKDIPPELILGKQALKEYAEHQAKPQPIDFTRINNDTNGNPRYVCHFLNFITPNDPGVSVGSVNGRYDLALSRSRQLGGRKFHNKQYGGGIVFQSYNTDQLEKDIYALMEQYK